MVIFLVALTAVSVVGSGKYIFQKWINPLTIYVVPWAIMLVLYDIKLLRYYDLTSQTWFVICAALFSFICGIILLINVYKPSAVERGGGAVTLVKNPNLLKYVIILFGSIGLFDALVHWSVLFSMYGSLPGILINANEIYRLRIEQKIPGLIPYLVAFGYAGVFVAGVYSAYKGKITLISLLPLLSVVLKEIANVGRAGILIALMMYFLAYFFTRNVVKTDKKIQKEKVSRRGQVFGLIVVIAILIAGASVVRSIRGTYESFAGATKALSGTRGGLIITPSIYLYFSAHVGVLNQFLKDENVNKGFGENTLLTVYSILSKVDLIERPSDYQEGYRIPFWTNTGTYLREIIEDFGYAGIFLFPFLLGMAATFFWFRLLNRKDMLSLVLLTYTGIIIGYSYVVMVSRLGLWTISLTILIITALLIPKLERLTD